MWSASNSTPTAASLTVSTRVLRDSCTRWESVPVIRCRSEDGRIRFGWVTAKAVGTYSVIRRHCPFWGSALWLTKPKPTFLPHHFTSFVSGPPPPLIVFWAGAPRHRRHISQTCTWSRPRSSQTDRLERDENWNDFKISSLKSAFCFLSTSWNEFILLFTNCHGVAVSHCLGVMVLGCQGVTVLRCQGVAV